MRFLVDECTGPAVARWLRQHSHEVFSVYEENRGMPDDDVIHKAFLEKWILITNDKDFGKKIYRENHPHHGVILLRLQNEHPVSKIHVIERLLEKYPNHLTNGFVVATETLIRFGRSQASGETTAGI